MAFTEGLCPKIQQRIADTFAANSPEMKYRKIGLLQALNSSINKAGVTQIQLDGGLSGKRRKVQLVYSDPYCNNVAAAGYDCTDFDSNNVEPSLKEIEVDIPANPFVPVNGQGNAIRLMFDRNEMRKLCDNNAEFLSKHIMGFLRNLEEGLNGALLAQLAAGIGTFADGSGSKGVPFYALSNGIQSPLRSAVHKIENEYSSILASGIPLLIGGNIPKNYSSDLKIGCCNANGVDMGAAAGSWYFFENQFIENVVGTADFFLLAPNAVQLVVWNKYAGDYAEEDLNHQVGILTSPITGIDYDMRIFWDAKCEKYFVELMSYSQLVIAPAGGCDIDGANGTLLFHACAEDEDVTCAES